MRIVHAYHCYAGGEWQDPLAEHLWALDRAGFDGDIILGLVGPTGHRRQARAAFTARYPAATIVEATTGFEQVTLAAVHAHARKHDGAVLYAHTKGAAHAHGGQARWRRSMTRYVVSGWRECAEALHDADAVGCHWITPDDTHPDWERPPSPHFAGNYWMARCDYLRRLPACSTRDRWDAERWIGLGDPRIHDLRPGWPHETAQAPLGVGRLIVPTKGGPSR